jgi:hypothetical protein
VGTASVATFFCWRRREGATEHSFWEAVEPPLRSSDEDWSVVPAACLASLMFWPTHHSSLVDDVLCSSSVTRRLRAP